MRRFQLNREVDRNGNSGIGIVAQGVQLDNGRVVLQWLSHYSSIAVFDSMFDLVKVHCRKGHDTGVEWIDESEYAHDAGALCFRCGNKLDPLAFVRDGIVFYHQKCWKRVLYEQAVARDSRKGSLTKVEIYGGEGEG